MSFIGQITYRERRENMSSVKYRFSREESKQWNIDAFYSKDYNTRHLS